MKLVLLAEVVTAPKPDEVRGADIADICDVPKGRGVAHELCWSRDQIYLLVYVCMHRYMYMCCMTCTITGQRDRDCYGCSPQAFPHPVFACVCTMRGRICTLNLWKILKSCRRLLQREKREKMYSLPETVSPTTLKIWQTLLIPASLYSPKVTQN